MRNNYTAIHSIQISWECMAVCLLCVWLFYYYNIRRGKIMQESHQKTRKHGHYTNSLYLTFILHTFMHLCPVIINHMSVTIIIIDTIGSQLFIMCVYSGLSKIIQFLYKMQTMLATPSYCYGWRSVPVGCKLSYTSIVSSARLHTRWRDWSSLALGTQTCDCRRRRNSNSGVYMT